MFLFEEICSRWSLGHQRNSLLYWRSLHHWLAGEARLAIADGFPMTAASLTTLAQLAYQHMLDLQPAREEVAA